MKKRADGRYQQLVNLGRGMDGKYIRRPAYGYTLKELAENVERLKAEARQGTLLGRDGSMPFSELAALWIRSYTPTLTDKTRDQYASLVRNYLNPAFGLCSLRELKKHNLQALLNDMAKAGRSQSLIHKTKVLATGILGIAEENDMIPKNVFNKATMPDMRKPPERQPLTAAQKDLVWRTYQGHRMGLPVLIMLCCGLRRGELLALTWKDINLERGFIAVTKSARLLDNNQSELAPPKTAAGLRRVTMPDALRNILRTAPRSSLYVCPSAEGGMMTPTAYRCAWESYQHFLFLEAGGRDATRSQHRAEASVPEFTAHQLRHTYSTDLHSAGVDLLAAQKLLGHANKETTLKVYTHLDEQTETTSLSAYNDYLTRSIEGVKATSKGPARDTKID